MALVQAPEAVVMVRPWAFHPNPETAADNAFQRSSPPIEGDVSIQARTEFDGMVEKLRAHGVVVHVFDDHGERETPDSVFPNNWFSTHQGGHVAIFPMYSPSRRRERREDVINMLKSQYRVQDIVDFSGLEYDNLFLEGTGAMVLDHFERVAYCVNSRRADPIVLERFCTHFQYEPMAFDATDNAGNAIYHTNVMLSIASDVVLIGDHTISDEARRKEVVARLDHSGRDVIHLTSEQINAFVGNAMELRGKDGLFLAISQRAYDSLEPEQIRRVETSLPIVTFDVPTIELAGGSVRCMLAGIHLSPR